MGRGRGGLYQEPRIARGVSKSDFGIAKNCSIYKVKREVYTKFETLPLLLISTLLNAV